MASHTKEGGNAQMNHQKKMMWAHKLIQECNDLENRLEKIEERKSVLEGESRTGAEVEEMSLNNPNQTST